MTIEQLRVGDMACQHCVNAIMQAVQAVPGVHKVEINLGEKAVRIERSEDVQVSTLISAIKAAGYEDVAVLV
jgi:copper chaperone CopZ